MELLNTATERHCELPVAVAVAVAVVPAVAAAAAVAAAKVLLLLVRARVREGSVQCVVHVGAPWLSMCAAACVHDWGVTEACGRLGLVSGCQVASPSRPRALVGHAGSRGGELGQRGRSATRHSRLFLFTPFSRVQLYTCMTRLCDLESAETVSIYYILG